MIFSNIKQFFTKNKKIFYYLGFFLVIFSISIDSTFALTKEEEMIETATTVINGFLMGISVILGLITYLTTIFLSPEWINGSLFSLNTKFHEVWILVSNIVYFIFAFILIWIAFMNIIGKNSDQYQLKQALPKFAIGVFMVPLSWFFVQFILSLSAVLTIGALTLPFNTFPDFNTKLGEVTIPKVCYLDLESFTTGSSESSKGFVYCDDEEGDAKIPISRLIDGGDSYGSIFGVISLYTYGILSFDTIDEINKGQLTKIKTLGDLIVKIVFDLFFVLVYAILMIALGMVLMTRGIYIWIYTMFSPVFGLMFFFDKKEGAGDGFFSKFSISKFFALAMVPVYSMLALSFGLLFIYVVGNGMTATTDTNSKIRVEESKLQVGEFSLIIKGEVATGENVTGLLDKIGGGMLGVVGALILKIFGIVILWGAVMAALKSSEITKAVVQPLSDFGDKVGQIASSAPANIPIFGGQSMNSLKTAAGSVEGSINRRSSDAGTKLGAKFLGEDEFVKNKNTHSAASTNTTRRDAVDWAIKTSTTKNAAELKQLNETMKKLFGEELNLKHGSSDVVKAQAWKEFLAKQKVNSKIDNGTSAEYTDRTKIENKMSSNPSAPVNPRAASANGDNIVEKDFGNNQVTIDVGNSPIKVTIDSDDKVTDPRQQKAVLRKIIKSLNKSKESTDAKTILKAFANNTDILESDNTYIAGKIYYNPTDKTFSDTKSSGYEDIKDGDELNKAIGGTFS